MENSMSKVMPSNEEIITEVSPHEESGWTVYFDEFFNQNINDENSSFFSSGLERSLISDAASSVAKKAAAAADDDDQVMGPFSLEKRCDRLSFKKRKTKLVDQLVDNDLEDTASSPVKSPKIYNLIKQLVRKPEQKEIMDIPQKKSTGASAQIDEGQLGVAGSTTGRDCNNDNNNDSELKKRGLCLVPLSMIANYLG